MLIKYPILFKKKKKHQPPLHTASARGGRPCWARHFGALSGLVALQAETEGREDVLLSTGLGKARGKRKVWGFVVLGFGCFLGLFLKVLGGFLEIQRLCLDVF